MKYDFLSDSNSQRAKDNLIYYEDFRKRELVDQRMQNDYKMKEESTVRTKEKQKRKSYQKFYYTKDEDPFERGQVEKAVAERLCRGETRPVVSPVSRFSPLLTAEAIEQKLREMTSSSNLK